MDKKTDTEETKELSARERRALAAQSQLEAEPQADPEPEQAQAPEPEPEPAPQEDKEEPEQATAGETPDRSDPDARADIDAGESAVVAIVDPRTEPVRVDVLPPSGTQFKVLSKIRCNGKEYETDDLIPGSEISTDYELLLEQGIIREWPTPA